MGFRYRKSINLGGGARLNLSKSGVGFSVGTKGARLTKTARGTTRSTLSIPGSGITYVSETGKSGKGRKNTVGSCDRLETAGAHGLPDTQEQTGSVCPEAETKRIFCAHCGQELSGGARFCSSCGHQIGQGKAAKKQPSPGVLLTLSIIYILLGLGFLASGAKVFGVIFLAVALLFLHARKKRKSDRTPMQ